MEEIYENIGKDSCVGSKASQNQRDPRNSQRSFYGAALLSLGLLSVGLLVGLISLGVLYHDSRHRSAARLSTVETNLTECLLDSANKSSSLYQDSDSLLKMCRQMETCPVGWRMFNWKCYLLSNESGTWDKASEDCKNRGAHLVVVDSEVEQVFISGFPKKDSWIGLTDREKEGLWKWVDGTPLTVTYWKTNQPDNGGGDPKWGEEDCAHVYLENKKWNDVSCNATLGWICEKTAWN